LGREKAGKGKDKIRQERSEQNVEEGRRCGKEGARADASSEKWAP